MSKLKKFFQFSFFPGHGHITTVWCVQELQGVDVMHKFNWIRLISRMFEAMAGNFAHPEDIQLFLNVLSGSLALHAGDSVILRHGRCSLLGAGCA